MSRAIIRDATPLDAESDIMIEFIDETSESLGTDMNRANLMAMQGFIGTETIFNDDGTIEEKNSKNERLITEFLDDGTIRETFSGEKVIIKTTIFTSNGISQTITEVLS